MIVFPNVNFGGQVNFVNLFSNFVVKCFALSFPAKIEIHSKIVWINTVYLSRIDKYVSQESMINVSFKYITEVLDICDPAIPTSRSQIAVAPVSVMTS